MSQQLTASDNDNLSFWSGYRAGTAVFAAWFLASLPLAVVDYLLARYLATQASSSLAADAAVDSFNLLCLVVFNLVPYLLLKHRRVPSALSIVFFSGAITALVWAGLIWLYSSQILNGSSQFGLTVNDYGAKGYVAAAIIGLILAFLITKICFGLGFSLFGRAKSKLTRGLAGLIAELVIIGYTVYAHFYKV